jgi:hypothetical protein
VRAGQQIVSALTWSKFLNDSSRDEGIRSRISVDECRGGNPGTEQLLEGECNDAALRRVIVNRAAAVLLQ